MKRQLLLSLPLRTPVHLVQALILSVVLSVCTTNALKSDAYDLVISLEEKNALELLKQISLDLPEDFMKTDFYLIRWLRVSQMNVVGARNLLMETVKWRQQNNMSRILSEDWSDMESDCPVTFIGQDKDGRPIRSIDAGDWDLRSIGLQGRMPRLLRYFQYTNEKQMQLIFKIHEDIGKPVTRFVMLLDASGLNLRNHVTCPRCLTTMIQWYTSSETHYPEFLGEVVVINAPSAVAVAMTAIRPFMSQDVKDRIRIFDTNKKVWMAYLDSRIDRNQRRERYGGTIKDY